MKKKVIIGLTVLIMILCVCLVACDKTPVEQDNQVGTDIHNDFDTIEEQGIDENDSPITPLPVVHASEEDMEEILSSQTHSKFIANIHANEKIAYTTEFIVDYDCPLNCYYTITITVDFTKLSNYQELLEQFGLSDTYETEEARIDAGYYTRFNEYYTEYSKEYLSNGINYVDKLLEDKPTSDVSFLEREQYTTFWYRNVSEANKEYDGIINLAKRKEVSMIHICGYILLPRCTVITTR